MDSKQWFREAGFGMMIHWGLYSLLGGEWKGERMNGYIAEWAQQYFRIPLDEYGKLCDCFNPVFFDAEEWVKLAKDAGMKYVVFTSKHHDGFAMFHSEVSKYNVFDATPFKRDVVAELAEACRKHGLKLGLYYSQDLDWQHPHGGGYTMGKVWCGDAAYLTNNWDYPDDKAKDYSICFEEKIKPQVKEILTKYGDLCLIWFDVPVTLSKDQTDELYRMVKKYQPDCLVNSRIGNGYGDYESAEDNFIPDANALDRLYESPCTMNDSWGYKYYDNNWKSADRIIDTLRHLRSVGANYLLNVGPDHLGRIPGPSVDILREVGRRINTPK
ncbi:MAG: alpha-L-fucosidase [Clostridia bacterium]|nr:alpha-L-fucosidase [Clostridia bacterium]